MGAPHACSAVAWCSPQPDAPVWCRWLQPTCVQHLQGESSLCTTRAPGHISCTLDVYLMYAGLPGGKQTERKGTGPQRLLTLSNFKVKGQFSLLKYKENHSLNLLFKPGGRSYSLGNGACSLKENRQDEAGPTANSAGCLSAWKLLAGF